MDSPQPIPPSMRKVSYVISIWSEHEADCPSSWRGALETVAGQHFNFATLTELNRLLCELGGWMDPPDTRSSIEMPEA